MRNSHNHRKARTRTLIQLGGLVETSGLLDHFDITLGQDLQKDEEIKNHVITLFGALLSLKQEMEQGEFSKALWRERGARGMVTG